MLCRKPFQCTSAEIHASLEYVMTPNTGEENGGEGLCVYLCDPSVPGWDTHFDGSGPVGFVGKKGAIVGVGIDCGGNFSNGHPGSVVIKRASDNTLLCDPVKPEAFSSTSGIITSKWKKLKIKFDIEENTITVKLGEIKILDDIKIEGVEIPSSVCVGVCAATSATRSNRVCVNKLKLKAEADDDDMGKSKADIVPPGCVDYKVEGGVLVTPTHITLTHITPTHSTFCELLFHCLPLHQHLKYFDCPFHQTEIICCSVDQIKLRIGGVLATQNWASLVLNCARGS